MLRTDSLEHVACLLTVKATACIRAKNIYPVFFGKDVAQFFELNRGLSLALFPQEMHTFPKPRPEVAQFVSVIFDSSSAISGDVSSKQSLPRKVALMTPD
jgi:hypothetical protein